MEREWCSECDEPLCVDTRTDKPRSGCKRPSEHGEGIVKTKRQREEQRKEIKHAAIFMNGKDDYGACVRVVKFPFRGTVMCETPFDFHLLRTFPGMAVEEVGKHQIDEWAKDLTDVLFGDDDDVDAVAQWLKTAVVECGPSDGVPLEDFRECVELKLRCGAYV